MLKNGSPVRAKQGEAFAGAHEKGTALKASIPEAHGGQKAIVFKIGAE